MPLRLAQSGNIESRGVEARLELGGRRYDRIEGGVFIE